MSAYTSLTKHLRAPSSGLQHISQQIQNTHPGHKICSSPLSFMLVPNPAVYSRPAKLSPACLMVCSSCLMVCSSCFRSNRRNFSYFPPPSHALLDFFLYTPLMCPLPQVAFPDKLTGPDSEFALVFGTCWSELGECNQLICISISRERL